MSDQTDQAIDTSAVDAEEFAKNMASVTDDQLREGIGGPMRDQILDEIFKRMEEHFRPEAAGDTEAIIHWRIGGGPGGAVDEFETVIKSGTCEVHRGFQSEGARVTLSMDGVDFLRLVTNNVPGPQLFMSGKLKIEGDMMFAATAASLFTIPGAPAAGGAGGPAAPAG
jgi:putative sterol carrier protein